MTNEIILSKGIIDVMKKHKLYGKIESIMAIVKDKKGCHTLWIVEDNLQEFMLLDRARFQLLKHDRYMKSQVNNWLNEGNKTNINENYIG